MRRFRIAGALVGLSFALARSAAAQLPDAATTLAELGYTPAQIAQVEAGNFVMGSIQPSSERELAATFAFLVQDSPADLVAQLRSGLLDEVDSNTLAFEMISGAPAPAQFAKLSLAPDAQKRAQAYTGAKPGGDLNLSSEEIAAFQKFGSGAAPAAVEQSVRSALLARLQAYQTKGLAGIAPYAMPGGKQRSPADELRAATQAAKQLEKHAPAAFKLLLDYPASKPPGTEESFRWSHFTAQGAPTIALAHGLYVPDGDAWLVVQRQFYVSRGYNAEQAIGALIPMKSGTLAVYSNRTSTEQVSGFGGGAKRAIGSKLLASQLEALFKKIQARERTGGR
jgi:hypothetical protein